MSDKKKRKFDKVVTLFSFFLVGRGEMYVFDKMSVV